MTTAQLADADRMMVFAAESKDGIGLRFADGAVGVIPFSVLPEVERGGGIKELELTDPYEVVLTTNGGEQTEIPWDFARHYCDRTYRPRVEAIARQGRRTMGRRIRELRDQAGLSQANLASRASLTRVTLTRIEGGEQSPRFSTLSAIARALGVPVEKLLVSPENQPSENVRVRIFPAGSPAPSAVCRQLLIQGKEELDRGEVRQASEKGWLAAAQMVMAIAEQRSWQYATPVHLFAAVDRLRDETSDPEVRLLFRAANSLCENSYQDWESATSVAEGLNDVSRFLGKLETIAPVV